MLFNFLEIYGFGEVGAIAWLLLAIWEDICLYGCFMSSSDFFKLLK